MRRRFNPWVVLLSAALTFGSLMAFVGNHSFGYYRGPFRDHRHGDFFHHGHDGCGEPVRVDRRPGNPRTEQTNPVTPDSSSVQ